MPFNLLILPLLGGYILVTYTNCAVYWSSRQAKEQLLFASASIGLFLALVARAVVLALLQCHWGVQLGLLMHRVLDFQGIGTAVLAFSLSLAFRWWINRAWVMTDAGFWLYGRGALTQLESLFMMSWSGLRPAPRAVFRSMPVEIVRRLGYSLPWIGPAMERRYGDALQFEALTPEDPVTGRIGPIPLLLTMKDRKVYIGLLEQMPSLAAGSFTHINLVALQSGYRDKDSLKVELTENYLSVFAEVSSALPRFKVLPVGDIASASLFDPEIFDGFRTSKKAA